jgi:hypothetical protein
VWILTPGCFLFSASTQAGAQQLLELASVYWLIEAGAGQAARRWKGGGSATGHEHQPLGLVWRQQRKLFVKAHASDAGEKQVAQD